MALRLLIHHSSALATQIELIKLHLNSYYVLSLSSARPTFGSGDDASGRRPPSGNPPRSGRVFVHPPVFRLLVQREPPTDSTDSTVGLFDWEEIKKLSSLQIVSLLCYVMACPPTGRTRACCVKCDSLTVARLPPEVTMSVPYRPMRHLSFSTSGRKSWFGFCHRACPLG